MRTPQLTSRRRLPWSAAAGIAVLAVLAAACDPAPAVQRTEPEGNPQSVPGSLPTAVTGTTSGPEGDLWDIDPEAPTQVELTCPPAPLELRLVGDYRYPLPCDASGRAYLPPWTSGFLVLDPRGDEWAPTPYRVDLTPAHRTRILPYRLNPVAPGAAPVVHEDEAPTLIGPWTTPDSVLGEVFPAEPSHALLNLTDAIELEGRLPVSGTGFKQADADEFTVMLPGGSHLRISCSPGVSFSTYPIGSPGIVACPSTGTATMEGPPLFITQLLVWPTVAADGPVPYRLHVEVVTP